MKEWFRKIFNSNKKSAEIDQNYLVIDLETTGLKPDKDHLLAWAAIPITAGKIYIENCYYSELNSMETYHSGAAKIHGILQNEGEENLHDSLEKFLDLSKDKVLVGHHIGFDISFLNKALKSCKMPLLKNKSIDTFTFYIEKEHGKYYNPDHIKKEDYSLDALCHRYQIDIPDRHTAYGDAWATALLWVKGII